jgi:hypothetical protein
MWSPTDFLINAPLQFQSMDIDSDGFSGATRWIRTDDLLESEYRGPALEMDPIFNSDRAIVRVASPDSVNSGTDRWESHSQDSINFHG